MKIYFLLASVLLSISFELFTSLMPLDCLNLVVNPVFSRTVHILLHNAFLINLFIETLITLLMRSCIVYYLNLCRNKSIHKLVDFKMPTLYEWNASQGNFIESTEATQSTQLYEDFCRRLSCSNCLIGLRFRKSVKLALLMDRLVYNGFQYLHEMPQL